MTTKRTYQCDLCSRSMDKDGADGVAIRWESGDVIRAVYLTNAEHHLCTACLTGLRSMFVELDKTTEMYRKLDAADASEAR